MAKSRRGVYWGRFNPPHKGHLKVIEHLLEAECDGLVIAIGSALASHEPKNPFTGGERLLMLKAMLEEAGLDRRCVIIQVPDVEGSYGATANNVLLLSPEFDVVFTNRPVIKDVFEKRGVRVKSFPDFARDAYSSTAVREAMLKGGGWEKLVSSSVARWLSGNRGIERIKLIQKDVF